MNVIIRFHLSSRDELVRWQKGLQAKPEDQVRFGRVLIEEMVRTLETTRGEPPGLLVDRSLDPPIYYWPFQPGVWVRYRIKDRPKRLFRIEREVLILGLLQPPDSSDTQ